MIAVGVVGLMMLTDQINRRYGATVILACFVLFQTPSIATGYMSTAMFGN